MRELASYSDSIVAAPRALRALIEKDERIVAFSVEDGRTFIYTHSAQWDDGNGSGTFCGNNTREAIKLYRATVTRNDAGRS